MHALNIFSSPIYRNIISDYNHNILKDLSDSLNYDDVFDSLGNPHKINKYDKHSGPFVDDVISKYNLESFSEELDKNIFEYCRYNDIHYSKEYCRDSWITNFSTNSHAQVHIHPDSDLSGVYYINTNGEDGSIFFQSPAPAMGFSNLFVSKSVFVLPPEEKILIIFPSWLPHGVTSNNTNNIRKSLSFNIKFKS